jgi:hypothetical protein
MDSVIIAAPHDYDLELRKRLSAQWTVVDGIDGTLIVDDGTSRVYVSRRDSLKEEMEPERLQKIISLTPVPVFYTADYSDWALVRRVLLSLVDDPKLIVDDDHDCILSGPEFTHLLRSRTDCYWRQDSQ